MYLGGESNEVKLELNQANEWIRLIALQNVVLEPGDYNLRHIFRWYSRTFSTPLHIVDSLPLHDILLHYFEFHYEQFEPNDVEAEIKRLTMSPETKIRVKREEDAADADAFEYAKIAEAEEKAKKLAEQLTKKKEGAMLPAASLPSVQPSTAPENPKTNKVEEPLIEGFSINFEDVELDIGDGPSFGPKE